MAVRKTNKKLNDRDQYLQACEYEKNNQYGFAYETFYPLAVDGNVYAAARLASYYKRGKGVEKNPERSFYWLTQASSNMEIPKGVGFELAECYASGWGTERNVAEAIKWYEREINLENGRERERCLYKAGCLRQEIHNDAKAFNWFHQFAVIASPETKYKAGFLRVAECYEKGKGTAMDTEMAIHWFRIYLEADDDPRVKMHVAQLYEKENQIAQALELFDELSKEGYTVAKRNADRLRDEIEGKQNGRENPELTAFKERVTGRIDLTAGASNAKTAEKDTNLIYKTGILGRDTSMNAIDPSRFTEKLPRVTSTIPIIERPTITATLPSSKIIDAYKAENRNTGIPFLDDLSSTTAKLPVISREDIIEESTSVVEPGFEQKAEKLVQSVETSQKDAENLENRDEHNVQNWAAAAKANVNDAAERSSYDNYGYALNEPETMVTSTTGSGSVYDAADAYAAANPSMTEERYAYEAAKVSDNRPAAEIPDFTGSGALTYPIDERTTAYYEGPLKNGLPEGMGKYWVEDRFGRRVKEMYEGYFTGGLLNGAGQYSYANGKILAGTFSNGVINGSGTIRFSNGTIFQGVFNQGYANGFGMLQTTMGVRFEGQFNNSYFCGDCRITYPDGTVYTGAVVSGTLNDEPLSVNVRLYNGQVFSFPL